MRKKSITSLIIVYIALCVSYGALSSRFIPTSSGAEEYVQSTVSNISAESDVSLEKETSSGERKSTDKDTEKETPSLNRSVSSKPEEESQNTEREMTSTEAPLTQEPASEKNTQSESSEYEYYYEQEDNKNEDEYYQFEDEEESEEEIIEEPTEVEPAPPTLEEYLQKLRCSGCRHNCSLLSPRCMNGARKANQAETEYYNMYS